MLDRGVTQVQLAEGAKASQSQVSRLLAGRSRRLSKATLRICGYATINTYVTKLSDPRKSEILVQALQRVWDGSDEHAKSIARVVSSLEDFKQE